MMEFYRALVLETPTQTRMNGIEREIRDQRGGIGFRFAAVVFHFERIRIPVSRSW